MKIPRILTSFFIPLLLLTTLLTSTASADGFIIIDPITPSINLSVKEHHVTVQIENQVARVDIDQTFHNPNDWEVEGTYLFPIPEDAVITDFAMWVDGDKLTGEILDADDASAIYNDYVMKMIDPALLEYTGSGLYKASIYPIAAGDDKRVEISYVQALPLEGGYLDFWYPLSTEKYSSDLLDSVSVQVEISTNEAIKSVYSPTHPTSVQLLSDTTATASYEATNVLPDQDYELLIGLDSEDFGLNVVTYNDGDEDGYFMLMAAPQVEIAEEDVMPKDIVFVLDVSGSMYGTKLDQAKDALKYVLDELADSSTEDRFNIVAFSDYISVFSESGLVDASSVNLDAAEDFIDDLEAIGGTDINGSLLEALDDLSSGGVASQIVVFLTDGEPTVGEVDTGVIAENVEAGNLADARVFVFGVGDDVNTHLLDAISGNSHSDSEMASLYDKIAYPVLSDLAISFESDPSEYDVYPKVLPDFYKGSQLLLFGRYNDAVGPTTATLTGTFKGETRTFTYDVDFPASASSVGSSSTDFGKDYIPTLWATRKIGYLLDEIRLSGESSELVNSVIELSKKYGVVTEYTSFLVDDDILDSYGEEGEWEEAATKSFSDALDDAQFVLPTGSGAFDAAESTQELKRNETLEDALSSYEVVKTVGAKTFYYSDERWVDSTYSSQGLTTLNFASPEYFAAVVDEPTLAPYFAIDHNVTVCVSDVCYATYGSGEDFIFYDILGHWAYEIILEYYEGEIIDGYSDGTFRPSDSVSRAEFVKIFVESYEAVVDSIYWGDDLMDVPDVAVETFTDVEEGDWFVDHLNFALENKIVLVGEDGLFNPKELVSRAEVLAMLSRLFDGISIIDFDSFKDDSFEFSDIHEMPSWALKYFDAAYGLELISGYDDGTVKPLKEVTRAESLKFVDNAINALVDYLKGTLEDL